MRTAAFPAIQAWRQLASFGIILSLTTSCTAAQDPSTAAGSPAAGAVVSSEFIYNDPAPTPACHASTLAFTGQTLLAAWFGGQREGHESVGIWLARMENAAGSAPAAWQPPVEVANGISEDGKRYPCWNPVLFAPKDAPVLLFYKVGPSPSKWWGMLITSSDAGKTWSKPITLPEGIAGPIKNKPILLDDGTLLCPSSTEDQGWRLHMEMTKDLGKTWEKSKPLNDGKEFGAIQPTLLSLGDGSLKLLCRSKQSKILTATSKDGGKTWSKLAPTELPNNNSGLDGVTLADGRHLLVYNHTPKGRTPLNVAISQDASGWAPVIVLETEPGEYSYPAVIQAPDGKVHITYTWKRLKVKHVVVDPTKLVARVPAEK